MKINEIEQSVYNFIDTEPRCRKEIISFVKNRKFTSHVTGDIVIKGLLRNGRLRVESVGKEKIYSVIDDLRLQYLAEKIALYDLHGHRIKRIAQYWGEFKIRDLVEDPEEISADVKSFSSDNWYTSMIRSNKEVTCSCTGFIFYDLPCVHVLALAVKQDKIGWLP